METEAAIRHGTMQVTALLLVAAVLLIVLGVSGIGASVLVVAGLLALGVVLYLARPDEDRIDPVAGIHVGQILAALWISPLLAALPFLVHLSATPGEVQAIGGLLGLAGMANYFLRPVYLLTYDLVLSLGSGSKRVNGR